jgi:Flp pilus assembly protein TadG
MIIRKFWSDSRGIAATEFALVAPILVVLALGAIDVGNAISENFDLKAAARIGAEYAVANSSDTDGIKLAVINANSTSASASVTSTVFCECSYQSAITCGETCEGDDPTPRKFVTVTVTDNYSPLFLPDDGEEDSYSIFEGVTQLEAEVTLRIK